MGFHITYSGIWSSGSWSANNFPYTIWVSGQSGEPGQWTLACGKLVCLWNQGTQTRQPDSGDIKLFWQVSHQTVPGAQYLSQDPKSVPFCSWSYRKMTSSHLAGLDQGHLWVLPWFLSRLLFVLPLLLRKGSHSPPTLCGFIEQFGQKGIVRDPDSAKTHSSQKLSDLLVGLGVYHGTDKLFPLRDKSVLPLGQVKSEIFHSVFANLGLLPRDFVSCHP
jgi:hypothetical protein